MVGDGRELRSRHLHHLPDLRGRTGAVQPAERGHADQPAEGDRGLAPGDCGRHERGQLLRRMAVPLIHRQQSRWLRRARDGQLSKRLAPLQS